MTDSTPCPPYRLRPHKPSDFSVITDWLTSERQFRLWTGAEAPWPPTPEWWHATDSEPGHFGFMLEDTTGHPVGTAELRIDTEKQTGHLMRILIGDRRTRGQGLGTSFLQTLTARAFESYDLRQISLRVFACNMPAVICYLRAGFHIIHSESRAFVFGGEDWDLHTMALERTNE